MLTLKSSEMRARFALAMLDASRRRSWTVADTWSPRKRAGAGSR
jgi:hypothetical protein